MANAGQAVGFFVVGGTLDREAASYVSRPADEHLLRCTLAGEYCNVLAARQTGKSSLMVRTAQRLKLQGVKAVIVDLTAIGSKVSAGEWYIGIISYLTRQLNLNFDEHEWWNARKENSPVQRFIDFLDEVILKRVNEPIVIFIDEIDSTLKLPFTDDFFAAIRAVYNPRAQNAELKRLTFVLLGVARPADLIKDRTRTPYNIGTAIDVTDFQIRELDVFEAILERACPRQGRRILEWILEWTGGQPYLTQKLSAEVLRQAIGSMAEDQLVLLVERLFLGDMARTETNLRSIRDQIKNNPHLEKMLRIYKRTLTKKRVVFEEQSIEQNELKLTGLVRTTPQGTLQIRNRIYASIFNEDWIKETTPISTTQRLAVAASIIAVLAILLAGYSYYRAQSQTAEIQARTYIDNFNNSNSEEVKIVSLAGLFALGAEYSTQAHGLFGALTPEQQIALFDLATPANVGKELVVVVGNVYQGLENTSTSNALLRAMADTLERTPAAGATSFTLEINAWLDGREAADRKDYSLAINLFTRALKFSRDREKENASILIDRANAYAMLSQFPQALADYDNVVAAQSQRAVEVENDILDNVSLASYWRENSSKYPNLSRLIATPTIVLTLDPTETQVPSKITDLQGITMNIVPAGAFAMGSEVNKSDENPIHTVYLDTYYMDKYEVTNVSYRLCVQARVCKPPASAGSYTRTSYYGDSLYDQYPVIHVNWDMAKAYCEWRGARLPTEAEWEKAARGTEGKQLYPWQGNPNLGEVANTCDRNCPFPWKTLNVDDGYDDTAPVGTFPAGASPYGVLDMAGNVYEWVSDWYGADYYASSPSSNPQGPANGQEHVIRGGAWWVTDAYNYAIRSTARITRNLEL